jgi:hypothetical protein
MGSSSRRQGILMKPSYNTRNLNFDCRMSTSLSSLPEIDITNLDTIDEENPEVQEVKTFLHRHDSHHDSDDDDDDDDDDSSSSVDEFKYRMQIEPEKEGSNANFFGNRLFKKPTTATATAATSKPPTTAASPTKRVKTTKYNKYRDSMISVDTNPGGTRKPLRNWYRTIVIKQSCHSLMAEDLMTKDMYYNTLSVGITAITSSAIFTSLAPSTGGGALDIAAGGNALAFTAGVLAASNTILQAVMKTLNFARRGEQHLVAFKNFTKMRFKMENLIGDSKNYNHHEEINEKNLNDWIEKYEELLEDEPIIPQEILEMITDREDNAGLKWTCSDTDDRQ